MSNFNWDKDLPEAPVSKEFQRFAEDGTMPLTFVSDDVVVTKSKLNKDRNMYIFDVESSEGVPAFMSTASIRLMTVLKAFTPLAGKTLTITRAGEGFDTYYTAERYLE